MWFKSDDQLAFHAKTLRAGNPAMGLWIRAGTWLSAQKRYDAPGVITVAELLTMGTQGQIRALIGAGGPGKPGFLVPCKYDGQKACRFHDWEDWQPVAQRVSERRTGMAERKRRSRRHAAGDHALCLAEHCEDAPPPPPDPDNEYA